MSRRRVLLTLATTLTATAGLLLPASPSQAATPRSVVRIASLSTCVGVQVGAAADVRAVVNAAAEGTTLCLAPVKYRLSGELRPKAGMVLQGMPGTVLDGSVPATSWTRSGALWYTAGLLPPAYTQTAGQCEDNVTNACQKNEDVFFDGQQLTRVMSLDKVTAGKFFPDYAANRIYLAQDPATHTVEVARTPYAIRSTAPRVTVRGVRVQHFASPAQRGAVFVEGTDWVIAHNEIQQNHALGLHLVEADRAVVRNNVVRANGQLGVGEYLSEGVLVADNVMSGNNTGGFWIADWESGGFKITNGSVTLRGNTVLDNKGVGIWADVDAKGVVIEGNTIARNAADGVRFEISYDGIVRNNTVTGNGFGMLRGGGTSIYAAAGINVNTSSNVEIYGNRVADNMNGIGLQMRNRGSGRYGTYQLLNNWVHDNAITMTSGSLWGQGATGLVQNVGDNTYFTSRGNRFTGNTYTLDSLSARRFAWAGTYGTIDFWRTSGQDAP